MTESRNDIMCLGVKGKILRYENLGNALVCIAIWADRRLHNVTNYFLFSLVRRFHISYIWICKIRLYLQAVADLLVCCIVMPLSILVEVRHGRNFIYPFSGFYIFSKMFRIYYSVDLYTYLLKG